MPRRSTAGCVRQGMGCLPAPTPFAYGAICGATGPGNLLVTLFGMGISDQNDPRTQGQALFRGMSTNKVFKLLCFIGGQCMG
jgi:hypothetical protein